METVLTIIHVLSSITIIIAILLQSGKGSGLAAGFGGASAGTEVFGGAGAGGFLSKATVWLAVIFMGTSLTLAYLSSQPKSAMSLEGGGAATTTQEDEIVEPGGSGGDEALEEPAEAAEPTDGAGAGEGVGPDSVPDMEPIEAAPGTEGTSEPTEDLGDEEGAVEQPGAAGQDGAGGEQGAGEQPDE